MATLQDVLIGLGFDVDASGLNEVDAAVQRAANGARNLGDKLRTAVGWIAGLATGGAMGYLVHQNMEFEKLNSMLITAEGSAEGATAAFAKIQKFAAKTPYDLAQVTEAYIKLKNLGLEPTEEAMTAYGNTASSMGKDLMQMIEAVADASTGEFERLKEFGIKASQSGEEVSFTFKGVTKKVKKDSSSIQKYLMGIGLKDFAGSMDRQSRTLEGRWGNLQDNISALARAVGTSGFFDALKDITGELVKMTSGGEDAAKVLGRTMGSALRQAWRFLNDVARMAREAYNALGQFEGLKKIALQLGLAIAAIKLGAFIALVAQAGPPLTAFVASLTLAAAAPYALAAALIAIGLMIQDFYVWLNGGEAALGGWFDFWYNFPNPVATAVLFVWEELQKLPAAMGAGTEGMLGWLYGFVASGTDLFGGFVSGVLRDVGSLGAGTLAALMGAGSAIIGWLSGIQKQVLGMIAGITGAIGGIPQTVAGALGQMGHLADLVARVSGDRTAGLAPGPRPALAGGGSVNQTINNTAHVGVTLPAGTSNPAAIGRAAGGAVGGALRGEAARTARNAPKPLR
jgi:hypothetical protein